MKKNKAFTLIELLVVISIISILSSIVLVSIRGAREKAQIARKIQQSVPFHRMLGVGLVGEWRFNGNYNDTSGNGNHLNINIGTEIVDSFHREFGRAVRFILDPSEVRHTINGFDNVTKSPLNLGGGDVSICLWIKVEHIPNWPLLVFGFIAPPENQYSIWKNNQNQLYFRIGDYVSQLTKRLELNTWYFIAMTYNENEEKISIYVDAEKTEESVDGSTHSWAPCSICWNAIILSFAYGSVLDDVRIYNEPFTEAQVRKMYAEEISRKGLVIENN